jgi:quinohemoprotein ethanol dehydrogenase
MGALKHYAACVMIVESDILVRHPLCLAYDLGTARGQEATPIVVDGAMYTSGTWGYVYALDAATGKELWKFDPRADPRAARNPCCDLVYGGVAIWKGKVFVASVDGRLNALDAKTGTATQVA